MKAFAMPSHEELGDWAKTIAAIAGVVAGAYALARQAWRRWRERRAMRDLERRAVRYLLDAQRHTLHFVIPTGDRGPNDVEQMVRQKALIDEMRDQVWIADGHGSEREREKLAEDVGKWLTRTQAIRIKKQQLGET